MTSLKRDWPCSIVVRDVLGERGGMGDETDPVIPVTSYPQSTGRPVVSKAR